MVKTRCQSSKDWQTATCTKWSPLQSSVVSYDLSSGKALQHLVLISMPARSCLTGDEPHMLPRWYEVYTMIRRLMLTSVPVGLDTLGQSTIYVIAVSVVTLVFERECQARTHHSNTSSITFISYAHISLIHTHTHCSLTATRTFRPSRTCCTGRS